MLQSSYHFFNLFDHKSISERHREGSLSSKNTPESVPDAERLLGLQQLFKLSPSGPLCSSQEPRPVLVVAKNIQILLSFVLNLSLCLLVIKIQVKQEIGNCKKLHKCL